MPRAAEECAGSCVVRVGRMEQGERHKWWRIARANALAAARLR